MSIATITGRRTAILVAAVLALATTVGGVAAKPRAANAASSGTLLAQLSTPAFPATSSVTLLTYCNDAFDPSQPCKTVSVPGSPGSPANGFQLAIPYTMGNASSVPSVETFSGTPLPTTVSGTPVRSDCAGKTGVLLYATGGSFQNGSASVSLTNNGTNGQSVNAGGGSTSYGQSIQQCLALLG